MTVSSSSVIAKPESPLYFIAESNTIMFGLRGAVGTVSDIGLRLRQCLVYDYGFECYVGVSFVQFHGLHLQCINIGGGGREIPDNKRLKTALQHIHGIGRSLACQILSRLNIENNLVRDLTGRELYVYLDLIVNKFIVQQKKDLKNQVKKDIVRLKDIQCYRGIRHSQGLPCRGHRTHTNARTWKEYVVFLYECCSGGFVAFLTNQPFAGIWPKFYYL
ncbi:small ribosomal subunit protein uS13m [Quercus suber]|uniref:small ribosomal subunit protein uS13m n=1 Tax=Quercus suber TaxID=58331 RepID=UPI0032DEDA8A